MSSTRSPCAPWYATWKPISIDNIIWSLSREKEHVNHNADVLLEEIRVLCSKSTCSSDFADTTTFFVIRPSVTQSVMLNYEKSSMWNAFLNNMIVCSKKIQLDTPTTNSSCLNETSYSRPTLSFFSSSARFSWSCVSASLICPGHQANVVSNTIHFWTNTTEVRPLETLRVCPSWGISQRFLRCVKSLDDFVVFTVTALIS